MEGPQGPVVPRTHETFAKEAVNLFRQRNEINYGKVDRSSLSYISLGSVYVCVGK